MPQLVFFCTVVVVVVVVVVGGVVGGVVGVVIVVELSLSALGFFLFFCSCDIRKSVMVLVLMLL